MTRAAQVRRVRLVTTPVNTLTDTINSAANQFDAAVFTPQSDASVTSVGKSLTIAIPHSTHTLPISPNADAVSLEDQLTIAQPSRVVALNQIATCRMVGSLLHAVVQFFSLVANRLQLNTKVFTRRKAQIMCYVYASSYRTRYVHGSVASTNHRFHPKSLMTRCLHYGNQRAKRLLPPLNACSLSHV